MKPQTHPWNLKEWIASAELQPGHHEEQAEGDGRIRKWLALADCLLKTDLH